VYLSALLLPELKKLIEDAEAQERIAVGLAEG
jgi:hypothetical protein